MPATFAPEQHNRGPGLVVIGPGPLQSLITAMFKTTNLNGINIAGQNFGTNMTWRR